MSILRQPLIRLGLASALIVAAPTVLVACGGEPPPAPKAEGKPVEKIGDNRFSVRKAWLGEQTSDKAWFGMEAQRALVAADDAGVHGLRIGAHPGSALAELGLNNGDLLRSVNGKSTEDVEAAARLLGDLGGAATFTFEIVRKGQPTTLIYEVK